MKTLWRDARLATLAGDDSWGLLERAAIVCDGEHIEWVGPVDALPAGMHIDAEHRLDGALVTPGLIDCHTHLIHAGERSEEFELRLNGASYEQIARAGGGIASTVAATRAASDETLYQLGFARARSLLAQGVTTLEIKSGYGLSEQHEARCLQAARRIGQALPLTVRTTCLAAHALPPEFAGRPDAYVDAVCEWLPRLNAAGLVDAVDAFCEQIGFTREQTRRVFDAARALGLPLRLHAEQLSDQRGAELAAQCGALSCDHLEYLEADGIAAMAAAGTVAVLLPGAYYFLRETRLPPVQALRDAGVPIALATDYNPGSSPLLAPALVLSMACTLFRLTPLEALRGITVHAATALGLRDRGRIAPRQRADLAAWPLDHPRELAYRIGQHEAPRVIIGGMEVTP